jgi:hypothetical protein
MRFYLFFLVWFSVLALGHWYVGKRIIVPARLERNAKRLAWFAVVMFFLSSQVPFLFFLNGMQARWLDMFSWAGYVFLGAFVLVFTFFTLRDLLLLLWRGLARAGNPSTKRTAANPERRRFLINASNIGIGAASAMLSGYGVVQAHRRAVVEMVDIPLPHLPDEFHGLRILQFSDLHVGPTIKRDYVERVVQQIHELEFDLIAFTGDLVDGSVAWLRDDVAPLKELSAPFGKFFITGNHEYYSGAMPWIREAERLQFDVLLNEHRILQKAESRLILAGVTDYGAGDFIPQQHSDPVAALADAPDGVPRILLAHQPRSIAAAEAAGYDLQLSGHTHGGQFFPGNYAARLNQPYIKGLHRHGGVWIYVNRGIGYWGPPMRIGAAPELTIIRLLRSSLLTSQEKRP